MRLTREQLYEAITDVLWTECGARCMDDDEDREATAKALFEMLDRFGLTEVL